MSSAGFCASNWCATNPLNGNLVVLSMFAQTAGLHAVCKYPANGASQGMQGSQHAHLCLTSPSCALSRTDDTFSRVRCGFIPEAPRTDIVAAAALGRNAASEDHGWRARVLAAAEPAHLYSFERSGIRRVAAFTRFMPVAKSAPINEDEILRCYGGGRLYMTSVIASSKSCAMRRLRRPNVS